MKSEESRVSCEYRRIKWIMNIQKEYQNVRYLVIGVMKIIKTVISVLQKKMRGNVLSATLIVIIMIGLLRE